MTETFANLNATVTQYRSFSNRYTLPEDRLSIAYDVAKISEKAGDCFLDASVHSLLIHNSEIREDGTKLSPFRFKSLISFDHLIILGGVSFVLFDELAGQRKRAESLVVKDTAVF